MPDQQSRTDSKPQLVEPLHEQINLCLRSGDYSRALDLLRSATAEFPNDAELSRLEKLAHDGVKRNAEANRLITESQELFAQRKSAEAIQLLRQAHELDKNNALARAILANALVEHAESLVETDWLQAETLTNQALKLNPAHPTAKTVHSLIVERKTNSSVDDWVTQARKLQSSGDLFTALAWVAEGLAVHPDDPKLLQVHDSIQRDQGARRRQARRGDLEDLRRMEREIAGATDVAAKQALAVRIQTVAAKHWTDGEILSIANALLLRLGLVGQESSSATPRGKDATVILHVPRPSVAEASPDAARQLAASEAISNPVQPENVPAAIVPVISDAASIAEQSKTEPSNARQPLVPTAQAKQQIPPPQAAVVAAVETSAAEPPSPSAQTKSSSSRREEPRRSNSTTLIAAAAVITLVAATFYVTRRHYAPPAATPPSAAPIVSAPASAAPTLATPPEATPEHAASEQISPEPSLPVAHATSGTAAEKVPPADRAKPARPNNDRAHDVPSRDIPPPVVQPSVRPHIAQPPVESVQKIQPQSLQPQPRLASLTIQGGTPGTTVLVDQTSVGTIQPDGTLSVSTVTPGDHTVELRKDRFKPRQLKKHFVAGETMALATGDTALEAAPSELTITFAPADATVALVKGEVLKTVSSGVPLNLAPGTYTLTARTAERFTRSSTVEVLAGQSKTLNLALAPNGMSKWDDPAAWKHEGDSFVRKGGDFVLYGVAPASGTFAFSATLAKGRLLQWVFNYSDPKNYILFQMDDDNFYRTVIRNGQKTGEIKVSDKADKKSLRTLQIRISPTEIIHQIKHGDRWTILDRWTQPGANLSLGKFGFYIPGNDQVSLSNFAHYADLNIR